MSTVQYQLESPQENSMKNSFNVNSELWICALEFQGWAL